MKLKLTKREQEMYCYYGYLDFIEASRCAGCDKATSKADCNSNPLYIAAIKETKGFDFDDNGIVRRIYFIEEQGKDVSFERWRLTLYYKSHLACTYFCESEKAYQDFLQTNQFYCFSCYEDFRSWSGR